MENGRGEERKKKEEGVEREDEGEDDEEQSEGVGDGEGGEKGGKGGERRGGEGGKENIPRCFPLDLCQAVSARELFDPVQHPGHTFLSGAISWDVPQIESPSADLQDSPKSRFPSRHYQQVVRAAYQNTAT
jgi:hypothetical protein